MPNAITNTKIKSGKDSRWVLLNLLSDGSEETDYVLYDSSSYNGADILNPTIKQVYISSSTAAAARFRLEFGATTDLLALALPNNNSKHIDLRAVGGIQNSAFGLAGNTGDIKLTTLGLESGDSLTLLLHVTA